MKLLYFIVMGGILILGMVYIYLHRQELGLTGLPGFGVSEDTSADQNAPVRMNWQKVDRSQNGFKVEMPAEVQELQVPAYNELGGTEPVEMILCNPNADTSFSVAWEDNPPVARINGHAPDRTMDMARDDALARTQTILIEEYRTNMDGFPARDFVGRNVGGGIINSRMIFAGQRLYLLSAAFPSSKARRAKDVTRFFNSFSFDRSVGSSEAQPRND
ncbi:MAG: hypothetical protein ABSF16_16140 [Terracidiphilus sp.]